MSQDIYCRERRNITFLGIYEEDINWFRDKITDDPCIHFNIFDLYTMKTVHVKPREIKHWDKGTLLFSFYNNNNSFDDDDILAIQLMGENIHVSDELKQTIVYKPSLLQNDVKKIYSELEKLQNEHGWDVIVLCSVVYKLSCPCPTKSSIPPNRILYEHSYILDRKNFEAQIRNPGWDRIQWLRRTEMENIQKSCFENQKIVINIIFYETQFNFFSHLQRVMAMVLHLSPNKIKFHFHFINYTVRFDREFLNNYLQFYRIHHKTISFNKQKSPVNIDWWNQKTRNLFLIVLYDSYLNKFCDFGQRITEAQAKHLYFYIIHPFTKDTDDIPERCKGIKNVHDIKMDISQDYEFFQIINKMVCETTTTKPLNFYTIGS